MIKKSVLKEDITILHVYVPNNTASKYMRQNFIEIQVEIDKSTITV